jgi:hypothetical protein
MPLDKLDIAMLEDVGTGADQLVQLDSNAKLPAIDASNLINIPAANLTGPLPAGDASAFTNLTAANINGTIPDAAFPAILPARNAQALTNLNAANLSGTMPAGMTLQGSGALITGLVASELSGTSSAIDGNAITNLNAANLTGTINSGITYAGDGGPLTNLNAANLTGTINSGITYAGDGNPLTNLNASNLGTGTIPDARFPATLPILDGSNLTNVAANIVGDGSALTNLTAANINGVGTLPSDRLIGQLPALDGSQLTGVQASLTGDGSGLTNLDSAQLTGTSAAIDGNAITNVNAANLTGTINSGITYAGDGGPLTNLTAGNLIGALPALDAGLLTNVPAGNLTGTVPLSNLVVKQVLSYTKVNGWSSSSDTFVNVPDMEISVTTTQLNSRLLVFGHLALSATSNYSWGGWHIRLTRDGTSMKVGTGASGETYDELGAMGGLTRSDPLHATHPAPFNEVDDPQVASGTTLVYKVQLAATHLFTGSTCTVHVNQSATPGASNGAGVGVSTITVLEVAA